MDLGDAVDVAQICGHALRVLDIVEGQLRDVLLRFHQQRQRLADTAGRTEDRHLLKLYAK